MTVATVFVAAVLCLCIPSIDPGTVADGTGEVIGMSYRSYSPSGDHGMDVRYHDDGRMWFAVTDPDTGEYVSGIFGAVAVTISDADGSVVKHLYPIKVMGQQWVDFGTPILPDGNYVVRMDDSSGTNIAESGLRVGGVGTITIRGSEDVSFDVPYGSAISSSGSTLNISFTADGTEYVLGSSMASVPQGSVFYGWSVDGEILSDGSKVIVSDDVSVTYSCVRWVAPTPVQIPDETEDESDDSVTVGYDGDGRMTNPIMIRPKDPNRVTPYQSKIAIGYMEGISENGADPQVVIVADESPIVIPSNMLEAITEHDGSLTVTIGDVTLSFDTIVLAEIGHTGDLELVVTRITAGIDDAIVYDICILRDGERISEIVSPIRVSIGYPLSDQQSEDDISVYHIDSYEKLEMTYSDGSVHFGIHHLGDYAIVHDVHTEQHAPWIWCILAVLVSLCSLIMIRYLRSG